MQRDEAKKKVREPAPEHTLRPIATPSSLPYSAPRRTSSANVYCTRKRWSNARQVACAHGGIVLTLLCGCQESDREYRTKLRQLKIRDEVRARGA